MTDDTQPIQTTPSSAEPEPASRTEPVATDPAIDPHAAAPTAAEPVAAVPPRARPGAATWVNVALGLAIAVAIGGVAFAVGRMTAPASLAAATGPGNGRTFVGGDLPAGGTGPGTGQGGKNGPRAFDGGAAIQGTVTAVTPDSITIRTASGQEITIALDSTTTYHQQSSATSSDVKSGGTVIVRLGLNETGSGSLAGPSATDVTIVPQ